LNLSSEPQFTTTALRASGQSGRAAIISELIALQDSPIIPTLPSQIGSAAIWLITWTQ